MWRLRSPPAPSARCARAGDSRPAMERIPCDRGCGGASLAMPGMRGPGGKDRATAVQGAVQQAVRRDRGGSLRECRRQSGGAAFPLAGDHRARDRHALLGTVGPAASQASAETDGVDEIYRGKNDKFLTVVSNLETGEPLWFGKERKKDCLLYTSDAADEEDSV